uniref:Uncharacterized protein n=1 Tax=viral metagenome TaxID=1070528 RepID=A0A6C0JNC9_9ZZZZ
MYYTTFLWIILNIIISIFIIYMLHTLWIYILDTYSTKKTKNIVNTQVNKYKKIINELQENNITNIQGSQTHEGRSKIEVESMDEVLTKYMQDELL